MPAFNEQIIDIHIFFYKENKIMRAEANGVEH